MKPADEGIEIATRIGNVVAKNLLTLGFQLYQKADQNRAVAAWFEIFAAAGIPPDAINACYLAAKIYRVDLFARGEKPPHMSAELVASMWQMSVRDAFYNSGKVLKIQNGKIHGCRQCFGTGKVHAGWNDEKMKLREMHKTKENCSHLDGFGNPTFGNDETMQPLENFAAEFPFD